MNMRTKVFTDSGENSPTTRASYILVLLAEIAGGIFAVYLYIRFLLAGGYDFSQSAEKRVEWIGYLIVILLCMVGLTYYFMNRYRIIRIIRIVTDFIFCMLGGGGLLGFPITYSVNATEYFNKITGVAFAILFELSALALLITYMKINEGLKKILMLISMVIIIALCQIPFFLEKIHDLFSNNIYEKTYGSMEKYERSAEIEKVIHHTFIQALLICGIVFAICLIIALILFFYDSRTRRYIRHLLLSLVNTILVIPFILGMSENVYTVTILMIIIIDILWCGVLRRCPSCGKLFALKGLGSEWISNEDINIKVENKIRDADGVIIGSKEQRVAGIKENYDLVFQCRYCGRLKRKRVEERREKV